MAESLDVISEQLKHLNSEVDKNFTALDNLEDILEKGITVKEYKDDKFGYKVESPFEKEARLEKMRIEADQHEDVMNIFEVINTNILKILSALRTGSVATGSSLASLLGKGLSLAGLASLLTAPVALALAPLNRLAKFFSRSSKVGTKTESLAAAVGETKVLAKEAETLSKVAATEKEVASAVKILKEERVGASAVKTVSKLSVWEKILGAFKLERFEKVVGLLGKTAKPVLSAIGGLASTFVKVWKFLFDNPILRFASKLAKVILVPLTILLGTIEVLRGVAAGYDKDKVRGAIIGGISAFVEFVTFGLIPFDEVYASLKEVTDRTISSYKLFMEGKIDEGFHDLGLAIGGFSKSLVEMVVKSLSHLGGWILNLFGFKEAADKLKKFGDDFNLAKATDDLIQTGASGLTKAGKAVGILPDTDEESATPVKGPDLGVLKRVYEDSTLALMKVDPDSPEATNLREKIESSKNSYNKELARRQTVNPLTVMGFKPIPDVITTPFVRSYDPDSLETTRRARGAQMEKDLQRTQNPVVIYNTPVQNITPPAPSTDTKAPIIAPIPVRNNESTWRLQQNSNISWN